MIFLTTFCAMEVVSWAVHKFLFHGPLWNLHRTHHEPAHHKLEANDVFSFGFAVTAALLVMFGASNFDWRFWTGLGITAYGLVYFVFHDLLIHRRVKTKWTMKNGYLKRMVRAHKLHHKDLSKRGSDSYGLLWVPRKMYFNRDER